MSTNNNSTSFPELSAVVHEQVNHLLTDIRDLGTKGYRVSPLVERIGSAAQALQDNTQHLSTLDLMIIENEIALTKKAVDYSISRRPYVHALYQIVWIVIWVGVVIPHRSSLYTFFGGGATANIVVIGAISGALGATLFSLGGLYKHRIHLDLSDKFTMWYILKPIVGALMGGFVGVMAGILVTGLGGGSHAASTPAVIILSAFGGMHEAWAMGLFQKVTGKALGSNNPSFGTTTNTTGQ